MKTKIAKTAASAAASSPSLSFTEVTSLISPYQTPFFSEHQRNLRLNQEGPDSVIDEPVRTSNTEGPDTTECSGPHFL